MNRKCAICKTEVGITLFFANKFRLIQCVNCQFIYTHPFPKKELLDEYYKSFNYQTGFLNEQSIRNDANQTLKELLQIVTKKGNLLDIGCGAGFFLDEATKKGWNAQGIDVAEEVTEYGRNVLKLPIISGDFVTTDFFSNKKFDVITLNQVIEHLTNPQLMLNKIYSSLKQTGIICIATPNINSLMSKIMKEKFNYIIPPEHVLYFSVFTLSKLLNTCQFKVIKIRSWGYPSDFAGIIKYLIKGKNEMNIKSENKDEIKIAHTNSLIRKIKSLLFDQVISKVFYKTLNIRNHGSMIEIYAQKI